MAKFKYRMQNILDIKEKMEESAKTEFREASQKVLEEEDKLTAIQEKKAEYEAEGEKLRAEKLSVSDIRNNSQAIAVLQGMGKRQEKELERAIEVQEEKRLKLQKAMQERKIQEKLYENALEEFMREENARENKEVDELTSYVYGKRGREGK